MVIIVEGVDRVGKSTLCKLLQSRLQAQLIKGVVYNSYNTVENQNKAFADVLVNVAEILKEYPNDKNVIVDRFHLSHYVYGVLNRGILDDSYNTVEDLLSTTNTLLVYVKPLNINRSSIEHGEDLTKHAALFETLLYDSKLPYLVTDYNSLHVTVDDIAEVICKCV